MDIDTILAGAAEDGNVLLATLETSPDADNIRLTPHKDGAPDAQSFVEVPRRLIAGVEPTAHWRSQAANAARVYAVRFRAADNFDVEKFLAAVNHHASSRHRQYPVGTIAQSVLPEGVVRGPISAWRYPAGFSSDDVLYEHELGFVLKPTQTFRCGGTAGWREAVTCGTVFLGNSRIEIENNGRGPNVGVQGLCIGCNSVLTLHPSIHTVYDTWFWGTNITLHNSFVAWNGSHDTSASVTMHH